MFIEFEFKGLALSAIAHIKPPVEPYRRGHPDNWAEGEDGEIKIESLQCGKVDAMFLLDADFSGELEDAAYNAAIKSGKRQAA
jgi:hypothetical protein